MKLISKGDLGTGERIFNTPTTPNNLQVRDPDRFPFVAELVRIVMEKDLRSGYVYAYLCHRFDGHANCMIWNVYALGPAGQEMQNVINEVESRVNDGEWIQLLVDQMPGDLPALERVVLAWLEGSLPFQVLDLDGPGQKRIFSTYNLGWRRMWRGRSTKPKED